MNKNFKNSEIPEALKKKLLDIADEYEEIMLDDDEDIFGGTEDSYASEVLWDRIFDLPEEPAFIDYMEKLTGKDIEEIEDEEIQEVLNSFMNMIEEGKLEESKEKVTYNVYGVYGGDGVYNSSFKGTAETEEQADDMVAEIEAEGASGAYYRKVVSGKEIKEESQKSANKEKETANKEAQAWLDSKKYTPPTGRIVSDEEADYKEGAMIGELEESKAEKRVYYTVYDKEGNSTSDEFGENDETAIQYAKDNGYVSVDKTTTYHKGNEVEDVEDESIWSLNESKDIKGIFDKKDAKSFRADIANAIGKSNSKGASIEVPETGKLLRNNSTIEYNMPIKYDGDIIGLGEEIATKLYDIIGSAKVEKVSCVPETKGKDTVLVLTITGPDVVAQSKKVEDKEVEEETNSYKQQFIDYCKDKIADLGTASVDIYGDGIDFEEMQKALELPVFREVSPAYVLLGDDDDYIVVDEDDNVILNGGAMASITTDVVELKFTRIDRQFYEDVLEYWDNLDLDEEFELADVTNNSREKIEKELKVPTPFRYNINDRLGGADVEVYCTEVPDLKATTTTMKVGKHIQNYFDIDGLWEVNIVDDKGKWQKYEYVTGWQEAMNLLKTQYEKVFNKKTEKKEERKDPEEGFEIDEEMANKIDGIEKDGIRANYIWDTNTVVFTLLDGKTYGEDSFDDEDDIDTIVYRNETPKEIKAYIDDLNDYYNKEKQEESKSPEDEFETNCKAWREQIDDTRKYIDEEWADGTEDDAKNLMTLEDLGNNVSKELANIGFQMGFATNTFTKTDDIEVAKNELADMVEHNIDDSELEDLTVADILNEIGGIGTMKKTEDIDSEHENIMNSLDGLYDEIFAIYEVVDVTSDDTESILDQASSDYYEGVLELVEYRTPEGKTGRGLHYKAGDKEALTTGRANDNTVIVQTNAVPKYRIIKTIPLEEELKTEAVGDKTYTAEDIKSLLDNGNIITISKSNYTPASFMIKDDKVVCRSKEITAGFGDWLPHPTFNEDKLVKHCIALQNDGFKITLK